jgi:superoxide dismutase
MDVFEHAYMTDYGINRKEYIEKISACWDWAVVEDRFNASL